MNHEARDEWGLAAEADRATIDGEPRNYCVDPQTCTPDPGPRPMSPEECTAQTEDYEFQLIWDFNGQTASALYGYADGTSYVRGPYDATAGNEWRETVGFEPDTFEVERCGETDRALHTWGGPFLAWGGGIGRRMDLLWSADCQVEDKPDFCPSESEFLPPAIDINNGCEPRSARWLDMTEWEGISFWGRRAPDGQPGIRLALGDTNTDDDIAFMQYAADPEAPRACERVKKCGCRNHRPCTRFLRTDLQTDLKTITDGRFLGGTIVSESFMCDGEPPEDFYYCYDPEVDPRPQRIQEDGKYLIGLDEEGNEVHYDWCGPTVCNSYMEGFQAVDPQFHGKPCTEYTFRTGLSDAYCFDPETDDPPAPSSSECGDHWMKAVEFSTDWQFYKIPFTQLLQQGWAKEFHELRIDQVSVVRFLWGRGYIDFWLDDVAFYRRKSD